jgi:hypothetical protein
MVRVGAKLAGIPVALPVWSQPLADTGLSIHLVIDNPETMAYVTEEMVAGSGKPGEEWLQRGLVNLRERTPAGCLETLDTDTGIRLCSVGDAYDAARALLVPELAPDAVEFGLFVSVPTRDVLLALPVTAHALGCVHFLKVLAEKHYKNDPYSISNQVYWVHGGTWHGFPIELRGNEVNVTPPPPFLAILDQLSPPGAQGTTKDGEQG